MKSQTKWYIKARHLFLVYLPVILICFLICLIYFCYVFTYITILINPKPGNERNYPFLHTSSPEYAMIKGQVLLSVVTFFLIMLLISLFRTVFINPGYFPSPLEYESKILMKNIKSRKKKLYIDSIEEENEEMIQEKYKYISSFKEVVTESPMTFTEGVSMREDITKLMPENDGVPSYNESIMQISNLTVSNPLIDPFDKYTGADLSKIPLCGSCLRIKAERSHHCRLCGRCVLKMDHHCPWLANCVGFKNYKYFCLIHLYGVISTLIIALSYWEVILNHNLDFNSGFFDISLSIFVYTANLGLFSFLFWLFYVNWGLVLTAQTVIENADRERFPSTKSHNIYDLGYYRNFVNVFGTNPLVWFLPFFANYNGKGIYFETNNMRA